MKKFLAALIGTIILGFGISLSVLCNLGTDPFTTMNLGISQTLGISLTIWQVLAHVICMILPLLYDRSYFGWGTLINMFLVGFLVDTFTGFYATLNLQLTLPIRLIVMVVGVFFVCLGCALYIAPNFGTSPWDSVAFVIQQKFMPRVSYRYIRMVQDFLGVAIGALLGATIGINTIITGFCLGPFIDLFTKKIADLLKLKDEATSTE